MARIRTIKPEFPHSESMGRVSRDARLLFILLWTICDDSGRTRGASRMLASLLFPYDDDAGRKMDGWLAELEREGCLWFYDIERSRYLQIAKWSIHQKIDKPSGAKCPDPREGSRVTREGSSEDLDRDPDLEEGPRSGPRPGSGGEHEGNRARSRSAGKPPKSPSRKTTLPDSWQPNAQHHTLAQEQGVDPDAEIAKFRDHAIATGRLMIDWDACFRTWLRNARRYGAPTNGNGRASPPTRSERIMESAREGLRIFEAAKAAKEQRQ